jgi:hypothetical protein
MSRDRGHLDRHAHWRGVPALWKEAGQTALGVLAGAFAWCAPPSPVAAADTPPALVDRPAAPASLEDCRLTLLARQAVLGDERFRDLDLGVSVHQNIAVLWGVVPDPVLVRAAEERVRGVLGVAGVRNELQTEGRGKERDAARARGTFAPPALRIERSRLDRRRDSTALTGQRDNGPVLATRDTTPLMPSIVLPDPHGKPPAAPAASLGPPIPYDANDALAALVENARHVDPRFRDIRVAIDNGVVRLGAASAQRDDVYLFASHLSHVQGVRRILVESSSTAEARR